MKVSRELYIKLKQYKMKKLYIRVATLFSGYDSQLMALIAAIKKSKSRFSSTLACWCDIERSVQSIHNVVFPEYADKCHPDVCKIDWNEIEDFDLLIYSSPCQSVSNRGKQDGMEKDSGTESSLVWEVERAIATKKPKWLIMENVDNMASNKFNDSFMEWNRTLASYGYVSYFKVLSSADFGVPQNRKRVFVVSRRIDPTDSNPTFSWPKEIKLTIKPEDYIEEMVDDKYYLTVEEQNLFLDLMRNAEKGYIKAIQVNNQPSKFLNSQFTRRVSYFVSPLCKNGTLPTLLAGLQSYTVSNMACCYMDRQPSVIEVWEGPSHITPIKIYDEDPSEQVATADKKCLDRKRILKTLEELKPNQYLRVRKLTPTECLRFMDVEEMYIKRMVEPFATLQKEGYTVEEVKKLMTVKGNTEKEKFTSITDYHLYGRAGNSIVVNVLTEVISEIVEWYDKHDEFLVDSQMLNNK